jgi:hypothetical protein
MRKKFVEGFPGWTLDSASLRVVDEDVIELWEIGSRQDDVGWAVGESKMERPNGGEREPGVELADSRGSRSGWLGKVVEVGCFVEEGNGEFEEGEGGRAEGREGRAVGVGEDLENDFGREVRVVEASYEC